MNRARVRRVAVALAWAALASAVRADDAVPPPVPVTPMPAAAPEPAEPSRVMTTRWGLRPWIGATTLRLGGLERFPLAELDRFERNWTKADGAVLDGHDVTLLNVGLVDGVDASFRLDPLVSVSARIAYLRSGEGRRVTRMSSAVATYRDEWEFETSMLMVMGGAGFHLPIGAKTRLNVSLFLGTADATVRIGHRTRKTYAGGIAYAEGSAVADGTAFVPEFAFELEREVTGSLALGAGLGYRFGGIESFTLRHATNVNMVASSGFETEEGRPLRDGNRALLTADYGGLVLTVHLTARM